MVTIDFDSDVVGTNPPGWVPGGLWDPEFYIVSNDEAQSIPNSFKVGGGSGSAVSYDEPLNGFLEVWVNRPFLGVWGGMVAAKSTLGALTSLTTVGPYVRIESGGEVYARTLFGSFDTGFVYSSGWMKFTFILDEDNFQYELLIDDMHAGFYHYYREVGPMVSTLLVGRNDTPGDYFDTIQIGPTGPPEAPTMHNYGLYGEANGPMSDGESVSSGAQLCVNNKSIRGTVFADQSGVLYIRQGDAPDALNHILDFDIDADVGDEFNVELEGLYCEAEFVNDSGNKMEVMRFTWKFGK